jgi:hypothetical protein
MLLPVKKPSPKTTPNTSNPGIAMMMSSVTPMFPTRRVYRRGGSDGMGREEVAWGLDLPGEFTQGFRSWTVKL